MSAPLPLGRAPALVALALAACMFLGAGATPASDLGGRQVTVFGIIASTQRTTLDPKLATIASQLRKLKPDYGFRLRAASSQRLDPGGVLTTVLGDGLEAQVTLIDPATPTGKLRLGFVLRRRGRVEYRTTVTTPPNQLFFCEKPLPGGDCLLIGVGAR